MGSLFVIGNFFFFSKKKFEFSKLLYKICRNPFLLLSDYDTNRRLYHGLNHGLNEQSTVVRKRGRCRVYGGATRWRKCLFIWADKCSGHREILISFYVSQKHTTESKERIKREWQWRNWEGQHCSMSNILSHTRSIEKGIQHRVILAKKGLLLANKPVRGRRPKNMQVTRLLQWTAFDWIWNTSMMSHMPNLNQTPSIVAVWLEDQSHL